MEVQIDSYPAAVEVYNKFLARNLNAIYFQLIHVAHRYSKGVREFACLAARKFATRFCPNGGEVTRRIEGSRRQSWATSIAVDGGYCKVCAGNMSFSSYYRWCEETRRAGKERSSSDKEISEPDVREARPRTRRLIKHSSKIYIFPSGQVGEEHPAVMLSVKGRDEFFSHLESALSRKRWIKETAAQVVGRRAGESQTSATASAGIAGILRRQEANRKATAEIASEAFSDLQSLIDKAKEVVVVVERYSAALQDKQASAAAGGEGRGAASSSGDGTGDKGDADREAEDLSNILLDIGIASPVTKSSAGTRYHQQLARQLADFLSSPPGGRAGARTILDRFGGMITLPDVFSIFNRARGTELVSPADLLMTAELLGPTRLGMSLRRFTSGVVVIQADSHSDRAMGERLVEAATEAENKDSSGWGNGIVATQIARDLRVSVTLAAEHLGTAENSGLLCRDDGVEGTRYFVNNFDVFVKQLEERRKDAEARHLER